MATPVNRGPGSVSNTFTAPSVNVTQATPQYTPQESEYERFRDAVLTAAGGVATAVSARAAINNRLKTLKEQAATRVEQDLARAARGLQQRRLQNADQSRQAILVEAGEKGMEWAERQFRTRMVNAGSAEEARLWEQAWQGASAEVSRENEEARQQAFNSAARTMEQTSLQLRQMLAESPELEAALIGDGTNIGARVQDWMLTELTQSVDMDTLSTEDADLLIHQAVKQSFRISDDLIGVHTKRVQDSNELLGTQQLEADLYSTLTGEQTPSRLRNQVEVTLRDRLNHLTPDQQLAYARQTALRQLQTMADGGFGLDAMDRLGAASEVLNLRIGGDEVFSPGERAQIAADLLQRAERTATQSMEAEITRLRELQTEVVTLPDGRVFHRPANNPDAALVSPDPVTGVSALDLKANELLNSMGLLRDPAELSPEGLRIVGAVRNAVNRARPAISREALKRVDEVANSNAVYGGEPGGDANKAHRYSFERRVRMSPDALRAAGQPPISAEELEVFKAQLVSVAEQARVPRSVIETWDGSPPDFTDENRDLNRVIAVSEARKWSNTDTQAQYGMPTDLVKDKMALLKSNDPNRLEAFAHFAVSLEAGNNEAWDNFLNAKGVSANEAAAAQWVRIHARLGAPGPEPVAPDPAQLMSQVQDIIGAPSPASWLGRDTGDLELQTSNAGNMAEVMAEIIGDAQRGVKFDPDRRDRFNRAVEAQLREMFVSENGAGRMLRQLWFAGRTVNPDLDDTQVGSMIWGWLQRDGWRFRKVGERMSLVVDPQGYTGEAGQDVGEHVSAHMNRPFRPQYRAFLAEALDLDATEVPHTLQDMWFRTVSGFDQEDPFGEGVLTPRWSFGDQVTDRLLDSRANYGGFVVRAQDGRGQELPHIVSVREATLRWPDGSSVVIPKGTVLNVINPDIFLPDRQEVRRRAQPSQPVVAPPTGAMGSGPGFLPGQGTRVNTPFQ